MARRYIGSGTEFYKTAAGEEIGGVSGSEVGAEFRRSR